MHIWQLFTDGIKTRYQAQNAKHNEEKRLQFVQKKCVSDSDNRKVNELINQ
jgi:hypothetical protein